MRTRSRVEGSGRTYAEEAKSSTVVEGERHTGVLWGERPRLEKEVKLRNILRETQLYKYIGTMTMDDRERVRDNRDKGARR